MMGMNASDVHDCTPSCTVSKPVFTHPNGPYVTYYIGHVEHSLHLLSISVHMVGVRFLCALLFKLFEQLGLAVGEV